MDPTPVYGARAEKPPKNADFAMKQTNTCRLSGDINNNVRSHWGPVSGPKILKWVHICQSYP